jgi:hypothetical protein
VPDFLLRLFDIYGEIVFNPLDFLASQASTYGVGDKKKKEQGEEEEGVRNIRKKRIRNIKDDFFNVNVFLNFVTFFT